MSSQRASRTNSDSLSVSDNCRPARPDDSRCGVKLAFIFSISFGPGRSFGSDGKSAGQILSSRTDIQARDPPFRFLVVRVIAFQYFGVVAGYHMLGGVGEPMQRRMAFKHVAHVVDQRKRPALLHVGVEMRGVRREDDPTAVGVH